MATVAYTSSVPMAGSPPAPQTDKVIDLAAVNLPVASVNLYGAAEDVPGAVFTWQWSIVDMPTGSAAAFSNVTAQNPTFGPIDIWGNYRLKLVATSNGAGGASEVDVLSAPDTAFVTIRVRSKQLGLEKPANFERNWRDPVDKYADKIEQVKTDLQNQTIAQHADVAAATGPKLDVLVNGSLAEIAGNPMHVHKGTAVSPATTTTPGTVLLAEAPADVNNPKAITQERITYCASVDGTPTGAGYVPGQIKVPTPIAGDTKPLCLWYIKDAVQLVAAGVAMTDAGPAAGGYFFALYIGTAAQWAAGLIAGLTAVYTPQAFTPGADNAPFALNLSAVGGPANLPADRWLGLLCTAEPATPGGGLTATLTTLRKV